MDNLKGCSYKIFSVSSKKKKNKTLTNVRKLCFNYPKVDLSGQRISEQYEASTIESINNDEVLKDFLNFKPDVTFSLGFPEIIKTAYLEKMGLVINYHNSYLPSYRGVYATHCAMLNDEKLCGISFHKIEKEVDVGPLYLQKKITLDYNKDAAGNELLKLKTAVQEIGSLLERVEKKFDPIAQTPSKQCMTHKMFSKKLDEIYESDKSKILKIIAICGGYQIKGKNVDELYVTKVSSEGEFLYVKGMPITLYKALKWLRLIS